MDTKRAVRVLHSSEYEKYSQESGIPVDIIKAQFSGLHEFAVKNNLVIEDNLTADELLDTLKNGKVLSTSDPNKILATNDELDCGLYGKLWLNEDAVGYVLERILGWCKTRSIQDKNFIKGLDRLEECVYWFNK